MANIRECIIPRIACIALIALASACASLPDEVDRTASAAIGDISGTRLHTDLTPLLDANPQQSGFHILPVGEDAFLTRVGLIRQADRTLDLQYYMWHEDLTGSGLFNAVVKAADSGVRVRLLLDDMNTAGMDPTLRALDTMKNIEVRLFNPFANRNNRLDDIVTDPLRINHRMHNKTLTVDGIATIFGGRNIGDEYFAADMELGFGDMDALAIGPIAKEVGSQFDLYWNSEYAYPITAFYDQEPDAEAIAAYRAAAAVKLETIMDSQYAAGLREMDLAQAESFSDLSYAWSEGIIAYDQPDKIVSRDIAPETHLFPTLLKGMNTAESDLLIISPYFIPGDELTEYLVGRAEAGVRVRILTNSLLSNDVPAVHAGYIRYRKALVEGGVELYELRADLGRSAGGGAKAIKPQKSSLHAKYMVFDEHWLWVGSYNMDGRSTIYNTEFGAYFIDPAEAKNQSAKFDERIMGVAFKVELDDDGDLAWVTQRDGELERFDKEPDTSWWERFTTGTLRMIVPEEQF
ncbi:phospholipase D family protein [Halioglobus maricola]|uniref:Phospholipase D family protein n=1 Tax=Halioglobus maricola TaxID=2601894 RepID=A0A5P9NN41_9GAMM|nr:phospholipase D family protein [Halioglobus maricola]QFU77240.1 phospholipase D family protein [Halioglobus maricola]